MEYKESTGLWSLVPIPSLPLGSCVTLGKSRNLSRSWLPQNDRVRLYLPENFIPDHETNDTNNTLMTSSKGPGVEKGTWVSQWMKLHGKAEGNQWLQATALLGAAVLSTWPSLLHVVLSSACERGALTIHSLPGRNQ